MIQSELYRDILEVLPILCIDLVIQNEDGEYLLTKRKNEPLKGEWWVIGGRVFKGETLEECARRKISEELSINIGSLECIGYYEDQFDKGPFEIKSNLHTLAVVFKAVIDKNDKINLDSQSSEWKFSDKLPERFLVKPFGNV